MVASFDNIVKCEGPAVPVSIALYRLPECVDVIDAFDMDDEVVVE